MSVTFGTNDRRLTEQLILYWHEKRAGLPFPDAKAFKERDIPHLWIDCYIAKVTSSKQNGFEMFWQGENVRNLVTAMEPHQETFYRAIMACFQGVRDKKQPNVEEGSVSISDDQHYRFRQIALPVGSASGEVTHIFGGIRCKLFDTTEEDTNLLELENATDEIIASAIQSVPLAADVEVSISQAVSQPSVSESALDAGLSPVDHISDERPIDVEPLPTAPSASGGAIVAKQADGSFLSPSQVMAAMKADASDQPVSAPETVPAPQSNHVPEPEPAPINQDLQAFSEQSDDESSDAPETLYVPLGGDNFRE